MFGRFVVAAVVGLTVFGGLAIVLADAFAPAGEATATRVAAMPGTHMTVVPATHMTRSPDSLRGSTQS